MTVRFTSRVRSVRPHGTHEIVLVAAARRDQPDRRTAAIANRAGIRNDRMNLIEPDAEGEVRQGDPSPREKPTPSVARRQGPSRGLGRPLRDQRPPLRDDLLDLGAIGCGVLRVRPAGDPAEHQRMSAAMARRPRRGRQHRSRRDCRRSTRQGRNLRPIATGRIASRQRALAFIARRRGH